MVNIYSNSNQVLLVLVLVLINIKILTDWKVEMLFKYSGISR